MKYIILAIAIITLLSACTSPTGQVTKEKTINLGAIFELSGIAAAQGEHSLKAAQLAIEEINNAGGINGKKITLSVQDNEGDKPAKAISAYHKLRSDGINIILGPQLSPSAIALEPIVCSDDAILFSSSAGVGRFVQACEKTFNTWPADSQASETLGEFVVKEGHQDILIMSSSQAWEKEQGEHVKIGIEKAGGNAKLIITSREDRDYKIHAIKAKEADAIVYTNWGYQHLTAKQFREAGINVPFYSVLISDDGIEAAQGAFEDTIVVSYYTPSQSFIDKYQEKYGTTPLFPADSTYDSIMILAKAIKRAGTEDVDAVITELRNIKSYKVVSGDLQFDEFGGVDKEKKFYVINNGERIDY